MQDKSNSQDFLYVSNGDSIIKIGRYSNLSNDDMKKAVGIVAGRAITEASGNMGEKDLRAVAETGVDLISIGALTHSVKALDISLKFKF